jgi:hypothetical protein
MQYVHAYVAEAALAKENGSVLPDTSLLIVVGPAASRQGAPADDGPEHLAAGQGLRVV